MRYPTIPWSMGAAPVARLVKALAVVDGATVVIGPPTIEARNLVPRDRS
jgi:hypothetical protein